MRVLLDHDIDVRLRHDFPEPFVAESTRYRGWNRYDNGELLSRAAEEYEALVTLDDSIPFQRNLPRYGLRVVVLKIREQTRAAFADLVPGIVEALSMLAPGEHAFVVDEKRCRGLDLRNGQPMVVVRPGTSQTLRATSPVASEPFGS